MMKRLRNFLLNLIGLKQGIVFRNGIPIGVRDGIRIRKQGQYSARLDSSHAWEVSLLGANADNKPIGYLKDGKDDIKILEVSVDPTSGGSKSKVGDFESFRSECHGLKNIVRYHPIEHRRYDRSGM